MPRSKKSSRRLPKPRNSMIELRPLVQRGAASTSLLDQRRREYETAKARLRALESKLQDRLITAPFAGVVGFRNISVGALIEPGDLITTLDDDSVMKLDFSVPSIHLESLGTELSIEATSPAFAGRKFEGTVTSIGTSRSIRSPARLLSGQFCPIRCVF
jgi:membrane fusion protein (multidrug efflux system)